MLYYWNCFCIDPTVPTDPTKNGTETRLELILGVLLPVLTIALCITLAYVTVRYKKGISICKVYQNDRPESPDPLYPSTGVSRIRIQDERHDSNPLLKMGPPSSSGRGTYTTDESLSSQRTTLTIKDMVDETTGSGSGLPILIQRSIAQQIKLDKEIGRGR